MGDAPEMQSKAKILVVDDNTVIVDIVCRTLSLQGIYEPIAAHDGVEALHRFIDEQPICVIIDVKMPLMDGYQLVRCLRGDASTAPAALVMLSALARDEDYLTGMLSGADEYLTKPFKIDALLAAIDRAIKRTPEERLARIEELLNASDLAPSTLGTTGESR